jgi:hypothetical protein
MMKKIKQDKPVGVKMYIYMGITQGNSLCSYLYLKQTKMSYFFLFPFSLFSSRKLEKRRAERVLPRESGRLVPVGGRWWGKGVGQ